MEPLTLKNLSDTYKRAIVARREPFQKLMGANPTEVVQVPQATQKFIPPPTVWPVFNVTVGPQRGEF